MQDAVHPTPLFELLGIALEDRSTHSIALHRKQGGSGTRLAIALKHLFVGFKNGI